MYFASRSYIDYYLMFPHNPTEVMVQLPSTVESFLFIAANVFLFLFFFGMQQVVDSVENVPELLLIRTEIIWQLAATQRGAMN